MIPPGFFDLHKTSRQFQDAFIWTASLVAIVSLLALFLTPIVIESHSSSIRHEIEAHVVPAQKLVDELEIGVAREASAIRGYILNGSEQFRAQFYEGETHVEQALERLDAISEFLSEDVQNSLEEFKREREYWIQPYVSLLDGGLSREDAVAGLTSQQDRYEATVRAAKRTGRAIESLAAVHRESMRSAEKAGNILMAILAVLTLASVGVVMWFSSRVRLLAAEMELRARREEALRLLASTLSAASTEQEILAAVTGSTRWILGAKGAIAGPLVRPRMRVSAASGIRCTPGTMLDISGSEIPEAPIDSDDSLSWPERDRPIARISYCDIPIKVYVLSDGEQEWAIGIADEPSDVAWPLTASPQILLDLTALALKRRRLFVGESEARAAAERAVRTRDEVLAIVSHDLRSPLTAISLSINSLRSAVAPEARDRLAAIVEQSVGRMDRLIRDLLDVARLQGGHKLSIETGTIDASRFVKETDETFSLLASSKTIQLECFGREDLPDVVADHARISQVIANLVGNALKFTPEGGRVGFKARYEGSNVVFSVEDSGPGIPAGDLEHIFDPYWQAARTARLGTGLGLPISKGIIEAHGGRIWVESRPGEGSTFYFTIPVAPGSRQPVNGTLETVAD